MKIIEWIRPLREASLAGKHVRLYMGNEAGDLDSGKNDSFMTHFTIYCMKITVNFSCEGNFKLFWVKFGIKCIPLRVNIDFNLFKIACCALAMSYCSQFVDPEIIHLPLFNFPQSHFNLKTEVRYALGLFDIRSGFLLSRPGNSNRLSIWWVKSSIKGS